MGKDGQQQGGLLGRIWRGLGLGVSQPAKATAKTPPVPAAGNAEGTSSGFAGGDLKPPPSEAWLNRWNEADRRIAYAIYRIPMPEESTQAWLDLLRRGEREHVRSWLHNNILPRVPIATQYQLLNAEGVRWATYEDLYDAGRVEEIDVDREGKVVLGSIWQRTEDGKFPADVVFDGEGHLMTIAMTGAGKTQVHVLPNVIDYEGPLVILDPKGEIYRELGRARRERGFVFPWAPFDDRIRSASFNPLDFIRDWEDAQSLATLLVPEGDRKDAFWNLSSRRMLTAFIFYVAKYEEEGSRNLQRVLDMMLNPKAPVTSPRRYNEDGSPLLRIEHVRELFVATNDPNLSDAADSLIGLMSNENHLSSFISIAQNELEPWRGPKIARLTRRTSPGWDPAQIWRDAFAADQAMRHGKPVPANAKHTVFLMVPPESIRPLAPVLRIIIGTHIREMLRVARETQSLDDATRDLPRHPVMFMLDELPQLGYIDQIEDAITIVRSARMRFWLFAQDVTQLRSIYPKWTSLVANCTAKMFYGVNDPETAEFASNLAGEKAGVESSQQRRLIAPHELMYPQLQGEQLIFIKDVVPIRAMAMPFRLNANLKARAAKARGREKRPDFVEPELIPAASLRVKPQSDCVGAKGAQTPRRDVARSQNERETSSDDRPRGRKVDISVRADGRARRSSNEKGLGTGKPRPPTDRSGDEH